MHSFCILFPAFCDGLREPDPEFYREAQALEALGIPWRVVNVAGLEKRNIELALQFFGEAPSPILLYRGWILRPAEYADLHRALRSRGATLFTSPAEYRRALLFPKFFPAIADHSFPAVWSAGKSPQRAVEAARSLGPGPYFIKDYAKSAKELWPDGCVADSENELPSVVRTLTRHRGKYFEGSIVIRPFVKLRYVAENPFGGKIYEEYRMFFFEGVMISRTAYDRVGGDPAGLSKFGFLPERIRSPFFTADVVVTEAGESFLLEIGDGGSSSLPPAVSSIEFYESISEIVSSEPQVGPRE